MGTNFYVTTYGTKTCECCGHIDHNARLKNTHWKTFWWVEIFVPSTARMGA